MIAIVSVYPDGRMNLKKAAREHLGMRGHQRLFLDMSEEIVLSTDETKGEEIELIKGNRVRMPGEALRRLGITEKSLVGLVERKNAAAVKKVEIVERKADRSRIFDVETTCTLTRVTESNLMPSELLPKLKERYKDFKLRYDVRDFLKGRRTLKAWGTRRILGIPEPSDEKLRAKLIEERLKKQRGDGSWEGRVTITARNLRELADLGMSRDDDEIQSGVRWLVNRPQSPYNPGMFFATDEMINEQQEVIEQRRKQRGGARERFNKRRAIEVNLVKAGDSLIGWPCGPRITWTTALALEALLKLGYEEEERVQAALRMLTMSRWCDNAQQHGLSGTGEIRRREPYSIEEIEKIEENCIQQFRYGGISGTEEIERADMAHIPFYMRRIAYKSTPDGEEYPLRMPDVGGGCPLIMTRALSQVKNKKLRRLAEAKLWKFAGWQHSPDGSFPGKYAERYFKCPQAAFLSIFAGYDHPVAKTAILKMIPWIVENQNEDGSWGHGSAKDTSTLAVVGALRSVELI